jgi:hypothetical protein
MLPQLDSDKPLPDLSSKRSVVGVDPATFKMGIGKALTFAWAAARRTPRSKRIPFYFYSISNRRNIHGDEDALNALQLSGLVVPISLAFIPGRRRQRLSYSDATPMVITRLLSRKYHQHHFQSPKTEALTPPRKKCPLILTPPFGTARGKGIPTDAWK